MIEKEVKNMIEAIFLDRDGTIDGSNEIQYPGDFQLFLPSKTSDYRHKETKHSAVFLYESARCCKRKGKEIRLYL